MSKNITTTAQLLTLALSVAAVSNTETTGEGNLIVSRTSMSGLPAVAIKHGDQSYLLSQAYAHNTDLVRVKDSSDEFDGSATGQIMNLSIEADKTRFDKLVNLLSALPVVTADVTIDRLKAPTTYDAMSRHGTTTTQRVVAAASVGVVVSGVAGVVGYAAGALITALGGSVLVSVGVLVAGVSALFYFDYGTKVANLAIGFSDFVLSTIWPAKGQASALSRIGNGIKAKALGLWGKVTGLFGRTQAA